MWKDTQSAVQLTWDPQHGQCWLCGVWVPAVIIPELDFLVTVRLSLIRCAGLWATRVSVCLYTQSVWERNCIQREVCPCAVTLWKQPSVLAGTQRLLSAVQCLQMEGSAVPAAHLALGIALQLEEPGQHRNTVWGGRGDGEQLLPAAMENMEKGL